MQFEEVENIETKLNMQIDWFLFSQQATYIHIYQRGGVL